MTRVIATVVLVLWSLPVFAEEPNQEVSQDAARLHEIFDREWEWRLQEYPTFATNVGRHEYNNRLSSMSLASIRRRAEGNARHLRDLDQVDRSKLSVTDQINYDMFQRNLQLALEGFKYGSYVFPINADSGFHSGFARLGSRVPLQTVKDYENYIARLHGFRLFTDQNIQLMREGMRTERTLPKVVLQGIEDTISAHIVEDPTESELWKPFGEFPTTVPDAEHDALRAAGRAAITEAVVPAYQVFFDFMVDEYIPAARESLGASELPEGRDFYQSEIRRYTTLDLTPEEIHQIGLDEVARIRSEMQTIIEEVGFEGSFAQFLEFLRTDRRFYPKSADELLKEASYIAKRMDAKLPSLFKTLPRLPYGVAPVPASIAPKYTAGRYVGAPEGSTQPGYYWVNTYALESRTLYTLEALTLHEAVPGHHLQGALSKELADLPNFRRYSYISAFGEGWGLYSEWLGLEAGFYTDPYSNFGRLTYEMWRACRLVVDTGIHALGWKRQQVVDFLSSNTALALHEIQTETDRYISWPAQALSYKLGELKIKELRTRAEAALGTRFDVREFHDAVLLNGSVPLPVLEEQIDNFIRDQAEMGS